MESLFKENKTILEKNPKSIIDEPLPKDCSVWLKKGFFYDAILCFDKSLHYYFAFKTLMAHGFENPGDLCRYYSNFFSRLGFLWLSGWALIHFNDLSKENILGLSLNSSFESKCQKEYSDEIKKTLEFLSRTFQLFFCWRKGCFKIKFNRGNEHKTTFQEFQKRFEKFDWGNDGHYTYFGKRPDHMTPKADYIECTERNSITYDLSDLMGEIMNPSYGSIAKIFSKINFLKSPDENYPDGAVESFNDRFCDTGYKEFFPAKYCELLLRLIYEIGKAFNEESSKKSLANILKERRNRLEKSIDTGSCSLAARPINEQKEYFLKVFDD